MRQFLLIFSILLCVQAYAQAPAGGRPGGAQGGRPMGANMNAGHFYGKVVDSKTNRGVEGVSVQLMASRMDTVTKKSTERAVKTVITQSNGDFDLENVPVFGQLKLKISAIGFKTVEQPVSFNLPRGGAAAGGGQNMLAMLDKDLGNIKIETDAANLGNVTVTTTRQLFEMGVDRKIFNVDRNLTSVGQTATEVMKSIPSLSVDIDGNVTMRNSTPQLFVDGRPTTLTMDQIPADIIDRVELITNPSAKFDASGGMAGILNIVLKKNKKTGYNGGIRTGIDSRGRVNLGADINLRQNKMNFFLSGNLFQRKSKSTSVTDRTNFGTFSRPTSRIYQEGNSVNQGYFAFVRGGFDYLIDIRNTITVAANYNRGHFDNRNLQRIDSNINNVASSYNDVRQNSNADFRNLGSQISYKHNFAKTGHEWTADVNYNASRNNNFNSINTQTFGLTNGRFYEPVLQRTLGSGSSKNIIAQTDYVNPISENQKIELGGRTSIRDFQSENNQFFYNPVSKIFEVSRSISNRYKFTDKVHAAYAIYSLKVNRFSYQFGLRAESSNYNGTLMAKNVFGADSTLDFNVEFPLSLFPSAFITYKLTDKQDVQFNYSRRINRPNFFQLMPFIDYSDPQNLSVGNPGLKPEFTNSLEISYNNNYKRGANLLISAFGKYSDNLITRFQYLGPNPDTAHHYSNYDSVLFNTFLNANNSVTVGIELTNRIGVTKWWDNTMNLNIFNSRINLDDPKEGQLTNQRTSWFLKMNNSFKLPKSYAIQLSGEYYARTVLPQEGGRGGGGGGGRGGGGPMMFGGGFGGTAQGYINPRYSFDIAVRKEWTWKGGNSASLALSMNDFLRTQVYSTYNESSFLVQTSRRRRDPQILRVNFNYRFGKFDVTLFKRRSTRGDEGGGNDMMMQ